MGYYAENTYNIVSRVAYLIGVDARFFGAEDKRYDGGVYQMLDEEKSSRIIRNLCLLRTAFHKRFKQIDNAIRFDLKRLTDLPELLPVDSIHQLLKDGINLYRANRLPAEYMTDINRLITENINDCRTFFPVWIKWDYVRNLFFNKSGLSAVGNRKANELYHTCYDLYPYQCFIYWNPSEEYGNILYHDKKFLESLYRMNGEIFQDTNNVLDANKRVKNEIYRFLEESNSAVLAVDCENSDPYKIYAMLLSLDQSMTQRISKILLFDDVHTTPAWKMLETVLSIPIEHNLVQRVKQQKSLVDISMATSICQEFYKNNVDSFILCASDSDYWGAMHVLQDAKFLICIEENFCSADFQHAMYNEGIPFCSLDDFCTGLTEELKVRVLVEEVKKKLKQYSFNIYELMKQVYEETRVPLTSEEKQQIYDRYIAPIGLFTDQEGNISVKIAADK